MHFAPTTGGCTAGGALNLRPSAGSLLLEELTEHLHAHEWVNFHLEFVQQRRRQLEEFLGGIDIDEHESVACSNKDAAVADLPRTEDSLHLGPDFC